MRQLPAEKARQAVAGAEGDEDETEAALRKIERLTDERPRDAGDRIGEPQADEADVGDDQQEPEASADRDARPGFTSGSCRFAGPCSVAVLIVSASSPAV